MILIRMKLRTSALYRLPSKLKEKKNPHSNHIPIRRHAGLSLIPIFGILCYECYDMLANVS